MATFRLLQDAWMRRHAEYERLEAKATSKRQIDSIRRTQANNVAALNLIRDWLANGRFSLDDEVPDDLV
jgi:hypothetical protein